MSTKDELELGPVDIVVIGYPPGSPQTGSAIPILIDLVDRGMACALHSGGHQRIGAFHHQGRSSEWRYDFEHSGLAVNELLEAPLHWFIIADLLRIEAATLRLDAGDRSKPQFA